MDNNLIDIFSGKYGLEREAASELLGQMDSVSFRKGEAVVDISCCNSRIPSKISIVSETNSVARRMSKARVDTLCGSSTGIANVIRKVFETNACVVPLGHPSVLEQNPRGDGAQRLKNIRL